MANPYNEGFIKRLEDLREADDRAALAVLRRALSGRKEDVWRAFQPVGYQLPPQPQQQDIFILIGALFAHHPQAGGNGNMGDHMAALRKTDPNKASSAERRFTVLVTTHPDDLSYHLRQVISLLASSGIPVKWPQLLYDVQYWDHPDRFVQRQWATQFWRAS